MAEGRLVALLHYAILACLVFGMDECCVVLCDWPTVLHSRVQPRFHSHLMIGKRGRWLFASDSFCFVLWMFAVVELLEVYFVCFDLEVFFGEFVPYFFFFSCQRRVFIKS